MSAQVIILMGVAGSGKTTLGKRLQEETGIEFLDGDSLHPISNIEKMKNGIPLEEVDRIPWLNILAQKAAEKILDNKSLFLACSALKRSYRKLLKGSEDNISFVYLDCDQNTALDRMQRRVGHFMPATLLQSQFDTLEVPSSDEAYRLSCKLSLAEQAKLVIKHFIIK